MLADVFVLRKTASAAQRRIINVRTKGKFYWVNSKSRRMDSEGSIL